MAIEIRTNQRVRRIAEGDILLGSFGYEASLACWYRVERRTPKTVVLQELRGRAISHRGFEGWQEVPSDEPTGKPFRRKVYPGTTPCGGFLDGYDVMETVWVEDFIHAVVWDGEPEWCFNWH